jgi:hypothetical protein
MLLRSTFTSLLAILHVKSGRIGLRPDAGDARAQSLSRFSEGAAARLMLLVIDRQQHGLREDYFPAGTVAA